MKRPFLFIAGLAIAGAATSALAQSPTQTNRTGMAAIGFAAFSSADVNQAVKIYRACPPNASCEIAVLGFSFGGFSNLDRFVKAVLPSLTQNQTLVVTVYLDDGANRDNTKSWCRFRPDLNAAAFWSAVEKNDRRLKNDWLNQVARPYARFANGLINWANTKKLRSRLKLVIVPVLEDGNSGTNVAEGWAYQRLIDWTRSAVPAGLGWRRNSTAGSADRIPGAAMEFHRDTVGALAAGDVITSDGVRDGKGFTNDTEWIEFQRKVLSRSATALFWWPSFNGNGPRTTAPWKRGKLKPLTTGSGADRATRLLTSR